MEMRVLILCSSHHLKYTQINKHMVGSLEDRLWGPPCVYIFVRIYGDEKVGDEHRITTHRNEISTFFGESNVNGTINFT